MTLLFDSEVFSVSEMRNRAFRQKITRNAIQAMYDAAGVDEPFDMYDFQDDAGLVGAINKGTGGVLGNMAWDNAALRTGDGWYVPPQIPGAHGFGMANDGGTSGYVGSVVSHTGNYVDGRSKFTIITMVNPNSDGQANFGRIVHKLNGFFVYLREEAAGFTKVAFLLVDSGGNTEIVTTNAVVPNNYWSQIACVYDGTQAVGSRMRIYVNGINQGTTPDTSENVITDAGNILYILDSDGNDRAFDGRLGLLAICPGLAMSQAQVQSLVELRGLFQPTVVNQPTIITPGHFGAPEYDFDGAADPNGDHFTSFQSQLLKTQQGSYIVWFSPDNFTTDGTLFALGQYGIFNDEYQIRCAGAAGGDPIALYLSVGAAVIRVGTFAGGTLNTQRNMVAITSDGSNVRTYLNGRLLALTMSIGVNDGFWFGDATNSNHASIGARLVGTVDRPLNGKEQKTLIYDRELPQYEIQQIYSRGFGLNGPRWYPEK